MRRSEWRLTPFFSADVLKKCALVACAQSEKREEAVKVDVKLLIWCPIWESEGEVWSEDESVSSSDSREDKVCNGALHVIG